ncbi:cytochrome P450 [Mycena vitilis]|nr:cytochrome P450 [Mycena vitilis]
MFVPTSLQLVQLISLLVALVFARYFCRRSRSSLPPGPRGLPILGNIFDLPKHSPWLAFADMGKKWGDIVSLTTFGTTLIIVNSVQIAEDLLDARGGNFADRPVIQMGGEMVGFRNVLALSQYGDRVRKERKLFHQLFGNSKAIEQFLPLLRSEIQKLLQNLLQKPRAALNQALYRASGAIVLRVAYGYDLAEGNDPFLELFDRRAVVAAQATQPTASLVDLLPFLRYWPAWLPGGHFHTVAKSWGKILQDSVDVPHAYVKSRMASENAQHSFTSALLHERPDEEYLIKWAASAITSGGSTTTSSQLEAFFLAMSLYPEVQAEAQRELDKVVGTDRLPDISDRPHLPYVNALCKEILRWHNAAPMGIPHRTREDSIYEREGHPSLFIPKNSLIIANIWNMAHNGEMYSDPMAFSPGRFISTETRDAEPDPARLCFGYGRRICPGKLLADASLFMTCSAVLAVFNIEKVYKDGVAVVPQLGQTTGTVSQPLPFECIVKARNAEVISLIHGID